MRKKHRYYRTAALLGPRTRYAAVRPKRKPIKIKIPWRFVLPVLAVIGLGLWIALSDLWFLLPEDLTVTGAPTRQLRIDAMVASDLLWWHRFGLKPALAEEAVVDQIVEFTDAEIRCGIFPTKCKIAVTLREPVFAWVDGATTYWVDSNGVVFEAWDQRTDLPVIRGPLPERADPHSIMEVMQGVAALAELGLSADELEYNAERGLIWVGSEGRRIAFGVGPDMQIRWRVYELLVDQLEAQGIFPWTMDVRFPGGVTYSLERSW
ncbi:MAG: cell division protein FtsQ/DivIB [Anaerolineae bacterium]